jgi:hypothetical protein
MSNSLVFAQIMADPDVGKFNNSDRPPDFASQPDQYRLASLLRLEFAARSS